MKRGITFVSLVLISILFISSCVELGPLGLIDKKIIYDCKDPLNDVKFLGYTTNVFKYYENSLCFILTSEWEDPGFAIVEAAASKIPLISSDCKNGPKEFINFDERGYLYKNYDFESFKSKFEEFMNDNKFNKDKLENKILNALKEAKKYTQFYHFKEIVKIIES